MRFVATFGWLLFLAGTACAQGALADYERAAGLTARFRDKVFRNTVSPRWLESGRRFWYVVDTGPGEREYVLVDARSGKRELAFDWRALTQTLRAKLGSDAPGSNPQLTILAFNDRTLELGAYGRRWRLDRRSQALGEIPGQAEGAAEGSLKPFLPPRRSGSGPETTLTLTNRSAATTDVFWMDPSGNRVKYFTLAPGVSQTSRTFAGHVWLFADPSGRALAAYEAVEGDCSAVWDGKSPAAPSEPRAPALSPDGKWRAFIRDGNVWIRPIGEGAEVRLTTDGKPTDDYGNRFEWSPDGRYLAAVRTEDGERREVRIVQSSPMDQLQPKQVVLNYLKPGDRIPHPRVVIVDTVERAPAQVDTALTPNPWAITHLNWSGDGKQLYFVYNQRGHQIVRMIAAAPDGSTRVLAEETSPTFVDYNHKLECRRLGKSTEAIWASERNGFNHLYLVNLKTGGMRPITAGNWMVRSIEQVDEEKRQLILRVMGQDPKQDPYHYHYVRVNFDGTGMTPLTEGDGSHRITWAPDGETYLDTYSRVDLAPVTELRRGRDGKLLATLERADASRLVAAGWQQPERFAAKGRDGKTDIFGIIVKPTNFDPAKRYPVIENIYAGPQDFFVPKTFRAAYYNGLAELGFIVVQIDGMGTNWRGKAFHDVCYQNLADSGFPDRILWMREAAKTRPWMDLSRVGVYGTSAGGQSAASAVMRFGDFYKAAVADCGCHDNRMDKIWWNELWMGWPVGPSYEANSNVTAAKDLKGKLYLMVGEVDSNVDPASTMQVVNALVRAGKDFDLLVVPNAGHGVLGQPYAWRRMQDFFVRNLWGLEPRRPVP